MNLAVAGLRVQQPSVLWTPPEARFAGRFSRPQNASTVVISPKLASHVHGTANVLGAFDLSVVYLTNDAMPSAWVKKAA